MADKVFAGAGQANGTEIWRIEKLEPKRIAKSDFGSFYSGDSYIVLNTRVSKDGSFDWNIHFWLGSQSSTDEQGTAAIMTVELDDYLGGGPVQHREVQGHESALFLSYFKEFGGLKILDGGVASGFNHVDPDKYEPRLLHLKGKRNVRVAQVKLSFKSMNQGDVFILDAGLTLYQWNGPKANKYEKFKGIEMLNQIKDSERSGRPKLVFLEGGKDDHGPDAEPFWKILGGSGPIMTEEEAGGDDDLKQHPPELFKVSDSSGALKVQSIAKGSLDRSVLDPNDTFIVDTGAELFVWIGSKATKQEKTSGMQHAVNLLKKSGRPDWCPVTRVVQNAEPASFKALFVQWDPPKKIDFAAKKAAKVAGKPSDTSALYTASKKKEAEAMLDDGSGKTTIWRIENLKAVPVPKDMYGQFYAGDSYIVLYEYEQKGKEFQILYFWQGRDSSTDEKSASALLTIHMDDELTAQGKDPTQVRVVMNKEPNHFYAIFKGTFVVHTGGIAGGFKNRDEKDSYDTDGVSLYHIKGSNEFNTRAIQVAEKTANLNSGDSFVLLTPKKLFLWYGAGASTGEKACAKKLSGLLKGSRTVTEIDEGKEPAEFWAPLGGKGEYSSTKELQVGSREPRLFQGTNVTGKFVLEELYDFVQDDLNDDDVFLLDTFEEVFVWVGTGSNAQEKEEAFKAALEYVQKAPDGRSKDTPVYKIEAGNEPPLFTAHFHGWDYSKTAIGDPYEAAKAAAKGLTKVTSMDSVYSFLDPKKHKFPYTDLKVKGKIDKIDLKRRHEYLSDEEFKNIFKVTLEEFDKFPEWKKTDLRKKAALF